MFFDDSSYSSLDSTSPERRLNDLRDEQAANYAKTTTAKRPPLMEDVMICTPDLVSFKGKNETPSSFMESPMLEMYHSEDLPPALKVDLSNRHMGNLGGECSIARTALTRATASKASPTFNEFCRVAAWAEQYETLIREYRLEAAGAATNDTFEFIFAIPLRKINGALNNQWADCNIHSPGKNPKPLRRILIDPYNQDLIFAATLHKADYLGKEFKLSPADASDSDGPYQMPNSSSNYVSLRDGHVFEGDAALECGIELDVSTVSDKETKVLAYWHEVSGQWFHVPLKSLNKVLIHQKRCVLNLFDVNRGRVTDDRLIIQAGVYTCAQ